MVKKFFAGNPGETIADAAKSKSQIWILFAVIHAVLFAVVSCFNMTQMVNHVIRSITSWTTSTANAIGGSALFGSMAGSALPVTKLPVSFDFLCPLVIFAAAMFLIEFAALHLALKVSHKKALSTVSVANVVALAGFPLSAALLGNLVLGGVYVPAVLFLFAAALLVHLVLLYEGLHRLGDYEKPPILAFSVLSAALCGAGLVAFLFAADQVEKLLRSAAVDSVGNMLSDGLSSLFGG